MNAKSTDIWTKMSHGSKSDEIGDRLIVKMSKDLHITKGQFVMLAICKMKENEYRGLIKDIIK